ncbi:unnamed protein product, partial [Ectocarpus fasciculatus]
ERGKEGTTQAAPRGSDRLRRRSSWECAGRIFARLCWLLHSRRWNGAATFIRRQRPARPCHKMAALPS